MPAQHQPGWPESDDPADSLHTSFHAPHTDFEETSPAASQEETELIESEQDFRHQAFDPRQVQLIRPVGEEVRSIAETMRQELHAFLHANTHRPPRFGFAAEAVPEVSIVPLVERAQAACARLEGIFGDRSSPEPLQINVRTFAHRVQSGLEEFLISLSGHLTPESIARNEVPDVLMQCISLKGHLATTMQEIDVMNAQVRQSILSQLRGDDAA